MASQAESIKWVPGTEFIVDGFKFQNPRCREYFLTHFHSDHTVGLNRGFKGGFIYCSPVTAQLLVHDMGIRPEVVKPLQVGVPVVISGVRVTPLDANHCPGSVMFLFEVPTPETKALGSGTSDSSRPATPGSAGRLLGGCDQRTSGVLGGGWECGGDGISGEARQTGTEEEALRIIEIQGEGGGGGCFASTHNILHTGDCRWQPWMRHQPGLAGVRVDTLFLDTTYAAAKHTLPPQSQAIDMMVQVMRDALAEEPRTVFLVAAYHIGKERAFLGAARQLGAKVWCSPSKRAVLRLLDLPGELMELLVEQPGDAAVHVTGWGLRPEDLQGYLDQHPGVWKRAVGIRPTGWTLRRSGGVSIRRDGNVAVVGVPYSEHSSWTDLCDAVAQLRPRRLVPTVNAATAAQRRALVDRFAHLMDLSADRSRLDVYLTPGGKQGGEDGPHAPSSSPSAQPTTEFKLAAGARGSSRWVDLAAVDVAQQEQILADLQRQHQFGEAVRRTPGVKRRSVTPKEAPVVTPGAKRRRSQPPPWRSSLAKGGTGPPGGCGLDAGTRTHSQPARSSAAGMQPAASEHGQQQQQPGSTKSEAVAHGSVQPAEAQAGKANGSAAGVPSRSGAAGGVAAERGGGSSRRAVACLIDLTLGDDDDTGDDAAGYASRRHGEASWQGLSLVAHTGDVGLAAAGGLGTVMGSRCRSADGCCSPRVPSLQSSIRRFFTPIRHMVAAGTG